MSIGLFPRYVLRNTCMRSTKLRILMVSKRASTHFGGAEIQALHLAQALLDLGVEVRVVSTKFASSLPQSEIIYGVPVQLLAVSRQELMSNFLAVKASEFALMAWYVATHRRTYDMVHAHCLSVSSLGATLGAQLSNQPVLIKPCVGGAEGDLQAILERRVTRPLLRLLRRIDRFAVQNQEIADELIEIGIPPQRCVPVKNGVNLDRFYPVSTAQRRQLRQQLGFPDEGPLALFVGRLVQQKGITSLLEAWQAVIAVQKNAMLVIVGSGPEVERIQRKTVKPDSHVVYLGTREDIAELMQAADVFVFPSPYEAFGNVVLEALATGLPVIACRTGIARHLAIDGVAGRLIDAPQPADLFRALHELLSTPDHHAALRARGPTLAAPYDIRRVAQEYLELYESMVKEKHRCAQSCGQ
jgi:glycosyltransferase involved in cell wall biosynthesis